MTKGAYFLHDPEHDVSYRISASDMRLSRGEVGYTEFAGKVMQFASVLLFESGSMKWQNGTLWRFDENGFVDQDYADVKWAAMVRQVFGSEPTDPDEKANWKMLMRRADANKDMMNWAKNPALRKRLDDYLINGKKHTKIKTTRGLTKVYKT